MSHQLETIIGYKFKNPKLLETALTHTSYANESRTPVHFLSGKRAGLLKAIRFVCPSFLCFSVYIPVKVTDMTKIRFTKEKEEALKSFSEYSRLRGIYQIIAKYSSLTINHSSIIVLYSYLWSFI